jgi:hypothetical protein
MDNDLIDSGMTEISNENKLIEEIEEQSQLSSNVDFMDFLP